MALALLQLAEEGLSPGLGPPDGRGHELGAAEVLGKGLQDKTAGEGSFISSTAAGRREMLSLFLISPVLWELGSPLPTSPIPGGVHPGMERLPMAR